MQYQLKQYKHRQVSASEWAATLPKFQILGIQNFHTYP